MAVYTEVGFDATVALCTRLGVGQLTALQGIRSGIENTNYYATTERGQWVLTLFERLTRAELPYYLKLMQHLAAAGIPVPAPQADESGELLHELAGKPAALVTRLPGSHRLAPTAAHCVQVGAMLARMHKAAADLPLAQQHLRGLAWWRETVPVVLPYLRQQQPAQAALLAVARHLLPHLPVSNGLKPEWVCRDPAVVTTCILDAARGSTAGRGVSGNPCCCYHRRIEAGQTCLTGVA